jgi:tetratricopeptide (TPR) repeat protein
LEILLRAGRPADAAAAARSFAAERGDEDPTALLLAASALDQSPAGAEEALGLARRARSAPSLPPRGVPLAWAVEARALRTLGWRDEALAAARQGLAASEAPLPVEVERNLQRVVGLCAFDRRETAAAVEAFRRVADLAPRDPDALNDLAWALAHEPATAAEALRIAARATDARPGDPNLWSTRAVAASAAADAKDAERSFRACLTLHEAAPATDPDARARAALRFAKFLSAAGRGEEAVAIARGVAGWKPAPSAALAAEARSVAESP